MPSLLALVGLVACGQLDDPMVRALQPNPGGSHQVWAFTSPDRVRWTRVEQPIAWGLNSLGLAVDGQGDVLVTGLQRVREPPWLEREVTGPSVHGLRFDGQAWSPERWSVRDPEAVSYIDPQPFEGEIWYAAPRGTVGDPAKRAEPNPIRSSPPPTTRFVAQHVVDPAPVRIGGELHLFLTQGADLLHLAGEPLTERHRLPGVTVPFALALDGQVLLLAQAPLGGRRQPVMATLDADQLAGPPGDLVPTWQAVVDLGPLRSCTSPVMGPSPAGGWLLLCVEEPGVDGRQP